MFREGGEATEVWAGLAGVFGRTVAGRRAIGGLVHFDRVYRGDDAVVRVSSLVFSCLLVLLVLLGMRMLLFDDGAEDC